MKRTRIQYMVGGTIAHISNEFNHLSSEAQRKFRYANQVQLVVSVVHLVNQKGYETLYPFNCTTKEALVEVSGAAEGERIEVTFEPFSKVKKIDGQVQYDWRGLPKYIVKLKPINLQLANSAFSQEVHIAQHALQVDVESVYSYTTPWGDNMKAFEGSYDTVDGNGRHKRQTLLFHGHSDQLKNLVVGATMRIEFFAKANPDKDKTTGEIKLLTNDFITLSENVWNFWPTELHIKNATMLSAPPSCNPFS